MVSNFIAQREWKEDWVRRCLQRFPSRSEHGRHGGHREGRHLHLLCPRLPPSSHSTPRGHPGGAGGGWPGQGGRAGPGASRAAGAARTGERRRGQRRARRAASPGAPPSSRLGARPGGGGGNAGASSQRPAARTHPRPPAPTPPAAPRHERRRWLQAESLPPRPPLAPVRRHYSLFAASGGDVVGLGRRLHLCRGPSCEGKAPSAGVRRLPVPPPSPRLSPAPASSSCSSYRWYKLLRHCFRSRPGSRWSFILSPT